GFEDKISRVPFDSDLTTLGKIIDATGHNRMAARNHDIVTMGRYVGIKNATVLIAQVSFEYPQDRPTNPCSRALRSDAFWESSMKYRTSEGNWSPIRAFAVTINRYGNCGFRRWAMACLTVIPLPPAP